MNRDFILLQYKLMQVPFILSFLGFVTLMLVGRQGLPYAAVGGWICFLWASENLMGKSLVGDNAVMMHLLPVSARTQAASKVLLLGFWTGVICSIPTYLMMRNGGQFIDEAVMGMDGGINNGASLFYRGLPKYRYAIDTTPSAFDVAVGDLMDGGAGIIQIAVMAVLVPLILFAIGCFFGAIVMLTQLYLHPLLKRLPTLVMSSIGMILATLSAGGIVFLVYFMTIHDYISLFAGELLLFTMFGSAAWILMKQATRHLESRYDVST